MAFAKIYYSEWFHKPFENMIDMFKRYILIEWWQNATAEEKFQYTIKMAEKREKSRRDIIILCNIDEPVKYIKERPIQPSSKYW